MYELDTKCDICGEWYEGDRPTTHRHCDGCEGSCLGAKRASRRFAVVRGPRMRHVSGASLAPLVRARTQGG
jgi:hypothetical protein